MEKKKKHTPARLRHQHQLSLPNRTQSLHPPSTLSDFDAVVTATFWSKQKTAWNMPCKLSPGQPAMNQLMWADGWMVLRFDTADFRNHGCSGRGPGTGNRLFSRGFQPSDPAEDAGIECKGILMFFGSWSVSSLKEQMVCTYCRSLSPPRALISSVITLLVAKHVILGCHCSLFLERCDQVFFLSNLDSVMDESDNKKAYSVNLSGVVMSDLIRSC